MKTETALALTKPETALRPLGAGILAYLDSDRRARRQLLRDSRKVMKAHRNANGYAETRSMLTAPESQTKLGKSVTPTYGLTLSPVDSAGVGNLCPWATACAKVCLMYTGHGQFTQTQTARIVHTKFLFAHPFESGILLAHEIMQAIKRHDGRVLIRLNVVSDLRWELIMPLAIERLSSLGAGFYDYSKAPTRLRNTDAYKITFSAHEKMTDAAIRKLTDNQFNVAVVTRASKETVKAYVEAGGRWNGIATADGVSSDDRTLDAPGRVVLLAALGGAKNDQSGFVRPLFTPSLIS